MNGIQLRENMWSKNIQSFEDIKESKPNEYNTLKESVCSIKNACKFYEQYKRIGITF